LAAYDPIVFDNLSRGNSWAVKWGGLHYGDLLNAADIRQAIKEHCPEAILHFAGLAYVGESAENPSVYYANNIIGTYHLLEAMRRCGIRKIVFSSSCATYGIPSEVPITEDQPQTPVNPYGFTKLACEKMLAHYQSAYDIQFFVLRYFNAAGADESLETGEYHAPETHLIPIVLESALGLRDKFTVNGNAHPTPDGTCIRDYIHVSDLASAHVIALEALLAGHETSIFNLGNGKGYSVFEVIRACEEITGKKITYDIGPPRHGEPSILVGDASKFITTFGWTKNSSSIEKIVSTAWNWLNWTQSLEFQHFHIRYQNKGRIQARSATRFDEA
jgi:UDP-glucose-4-epimerase GalE